MLRRAASIIRRRSIMTLAQFDGVIADFTFIYATRREPTYQAIFRSVESSPEFDPLDKLWPLVKFNEFLMTKKMESRTPEAWLYHCEFQQTLHDVAFDLRRHSSKLPAHRELQFSRMYAATFPLVMDLD